MNLLKSYKKYVIKSEHTNIEQTFNQLKYTSHRFGSVRGNFQPYKFIIEGLQTRPLNLEVSYFR